MESPPSGCTFSASVFFALSFSLSLSFSLTLTQTLAHTLSLSLVHFLHQKNEFKIMKLSPSQNLNVQKISDWKERTEKLDSSWNQNISSFLLRFWIEKSASSRIIYVSRMMSFDTVESEPEPEPENPVDTAPDDLWRPEFCRIGEKVLWRRIGSCRQNKPTSRATTFFLIGHA